jgi:hypothetical protein
VYISNLLLIIHVSFTINLSWIETLHFLSTRSNSCPAMARVSEPDDEMLFFFVFLTYPRGRGNGNIFKYVLLA